MIDFTSDESHVLLNPRMPADERARLERAVPDWKGFVYVATSGTTGALKLVALSKEAILASAAAVNERLAATKRDVWCRVLPAFHVGGLGIHARARLSASRVIEMDWDVDSFARCGATLASLVPAQVHDLVAAKRRAPAGIRQILVGAGSFDPQLQADARDLGWPVLATYGMSECASTIAVEDDLLGHLRARQESDGRIALAGSSLFRAYVLADGTVTDPKVGGWFISDDYGEVSRGRVHIRGRASDFVKIGGESVDLLRLDRILNNARVAAGVGDAAIFAVPDPRLGHVIHLATTGEPGSLVKHFNEQVLPFERIRAEHRVDSIPRSSLGKLIRGRLVALTRVVE